tara:strand:+ start:164 stop:526 length:363 start_codon:yes stop_codon:yes gene_type:complete
MTTRNNAFESFINNILRTHEGNDKLRALSSSDSLKDSVDKFLFESQLDAFFIPGAEEDNTTYQETLKRLAKLQLAIFNHKPVNHNDYDILGMIIVKYSEKNIRLSKEILLYLNNLYTQHK